MAAEKIEISKFNFWLITALLTALIVGAGTWATSINNQMVKGQISRATMQATLVSVDTRLKDYLALAGELHAMEADMREIKVNTDANTKELALVRGLGFLVDAQEQRMRRMEDKHVILSNTITDLQKRSD